MEEFTDLTQEELEEFHFYLDFDQEKRKELCNNIINQMMSTIKHHIKKEEDRKEALLGLVDITLEYHKQVENYEICQVLVDIRNILNEPTH